MVKLAAANDEEKAKAIEVLTYLNDMRLPIGRQETRLDIEYHPGTA